MTSTASIIVYLLIILYATSFVYSQSSCDPNAPPKTTTLRLKKDLLCGYDKQMRPHTTHPNETTVTLLMIPKYMDFEESSSILKVMSWFGMSWTDTHLKWDPSKYDFISSLLLDSKTIWVPDLTLNSFATLGLTLDSMKVPCVVDNSGIVRTIVQSSLEFHCISDWYNWPYDVHTCEITTESLAWIGSRLDVDQSYRKGLYMDYFMRHREWDLLSSSIKRRVRYYGQQNDTNAIYDVGLKFQFIFKRHASVYVASYVVPGIVMMLMSLCVLWIDPGQTQRMAILCTLVILQSLYLQYIAYKVPSNGDQTPRVVCFYRDSLFMTGILLIVTVITQQMSSTTWKPAFLQSVSNFVATNKPAKFILLIDSNPKSAAELVEPDEEGVTLVSSNQGGPHQWQMLSLLINRLAFLFTFIIYLYLSLYLIP